jgi:hypothetical protein
MSRKVLQFLYVFQQSASALPLQADGPWNTALAEPSTDRASVARTMRAKCCT